MVAFPHNLPDPIAPIPIINLARPFARRAAAALAAGRVVEAAILLRESCRRQLEAMASFYNCVPKKQRYRTPGGYARVLCKAGIINAEERDFYLICIDHGNAAAHARKIVAEYIAGSLEILEACIDTWPCCERGGVSLLGTEGGAI
jgi:hypothetical protein